MLALGALLAAGLAIASRKLFVFEDPRIDSVEALLPGANCGACGMPGGRAFAEAVVKGSRSPAGCSVSSPEALNSIAALLGVEVGSRVKKVARLACAGGKNVAVQRAVYEGIPSCRAADLTTGGGKGCIWGCLGLADCERACSFGAITMNEQGLPVVDVDKCTACGDCVAACPRKLFSIHPVTDRLWVACKNENPAEAAERECEVACIGCGRCAMDAPQGVIVMKNNLAVIDYELNDRTSQDIIKRCPTGAIGWFDERRGFVKGPSAKKIVRKGPLPIG